MVTLPININGSSYNISNFRGARHIIIPEGIEVISNNAFYQSDLLSVILPEGLVSIGDSAFSYNPNLKEVLSSISL